MSTLAPGTRYRDWLTFWKHRRYWFHLKSIAPPGTETDMVTDGGVFGVTDTGVQGVTN